MVYNRQNKKMKKAFKTLFVLCLMASPLFFAACEKEEDENNTRSEYNEHDDDWGKGTAANYGFAEGTCTYNVNQ